MARITLPPRDLVRQVLDYDPDTGRFVWLHRSPRLFQSPLRAALWNGRYAGTYAGGPHGFGYWAIMIRPYGHFYAHRLAWLLIYGEPVPETIDHIDRDKRNNAIANLRAASAGQNHINSGLFAHNTSGVRGVHIKRGRFLAKIRFNQRHIHLGTYATIEEAAAAYRAAAISLFGEFADD